MATNEGAQVDAAIGSSGAFAALYEQSGLALAFFSIGGRFLRVNAAFCRLLGYAEEELLQKTHLDVVHVDDMEATAIARAQVISGKARARITERRYVHKDGSTIWAHAIGAVVRDAPGDALCTVLVLDDITSIKRSQRNAKRRFRRLIEMGSEWYWVQDTEFRFVEVPGIEMEHLDDTDIVIGATRWQLPGLAALPEKAWEQHRSKLARHEAFSDFVFLRHNKAGELIAVKITSFNLDFGGRRARLGVIEDLTERLQAEERAQESERRYRELLEQRARG